MHPRHRPESALTAMPESWSTRLERIGFNFFPAVFGTGATITYIASDYREVRVRLPLSWRTRNYVGTIFGGSMYAATDPIYMVMLYKLLGSKYIVWDKAATIRFRKPGRATLYAKFVVDTSETQAIRDILKTRPKYWTKHESHRPTRANQDSDSAASAARNPVPHGTNCKKAFHHAAPEL